MTIHINTAVRLTTPRRLLLAVGAMYLLAWFLPSTDEPSRVEDGLAATLWALSPLFGDDHWGSWWGQTLSVASAFTNVVFIVALIHAWRWTSPDRLAAVAAGEGQRFRRAVWAVGASALLNLCWPVLWRSRHGLLLGYYLWFFAFVALALVLVWVRRGAAVAAGVWRPALLALSAIFAAYFANFAAKDLRFGGIVGVDTARMYAALAMPDSVPDLGADTLVTRIVVGHDKNWRALDDPFYTHFSSKYRTALWLCSRTTTSSHRDRWTPRSSVCAVRTGLSET